MKSFEYKKAANGKFTVKTKGIELKTGRSVKQFHSEKVTGKYNVYHVTRAMLDKLIDRYFDFIPQFGCND